MSALSTYLEASKLSVNEFGRKLGVSAGAVSRYLTGNRRPSIDIAIRIEEQTGGAVPVSSWRTTKSRHARRVARPAV